MSERATSRGTASAVAFLLALLLLQGCGTVGYLFHVARGQARVLFGRVPIEEVLARENLAPAARAKLELVLSVRRFAIEKIGLHAAGTYTKIYDTRGGPAAWNLSACAADAFEPKLWWFPIVGTVPYKGFFDRAEAEGEKHELEAEGLDVMLYGASAYSTLGWFDDPLFTSMLRADDADLASTVIHELTHATVWVPGSVELNETLAQFVGQEGACAYFRSLEGEDSPRAKDAEASFQDDETFAQAIGELATRLEKIYELDLPRAEKLARKAREIDDFVHRRYPEEVRPKLLTGDFDQVIEKRKLDNASILAMQRYHRDGPLFVALHRKLGRDLRRTVARLVELADEDEPRAAIEREAR